MATNSRWFDSNQYIQEASQWAKAIHRGENIAILFVPKADRPRRLDQFLNDTEILKNKLGRKTVFQVVDISLLSDKEDLYDIISRALNSSSISNSTLMFSEWITYFIKEKIHLVLVLPEAEKLLNPMGKQSFSFLSSLTQEYDQTITVMSLFEADLTHPSQITNLPSSTTLFQNIFYYPLYDANDTRSLVSYLSKRWSMRITKREEDRMLAACGGHLWLVAEAEREVEVNKKWTWNNESMLFRLNLIFRSFSACEQQVLKKIILGKKDFSEEELYSFSYLKRMRVVLANNKCSIAMFKDYILNQEDTSVALSINGDQLQLDQIPVTKFFSRSEYRVLKLLLTHRGEIVTRENVARTIWPKDDNYSDWAIDQTISRIRKKCTELTLPTTLIRVVRGKGYILK